MLKRRGMLAALLSLAAFTIFFVTVSGADAASDGSLSCTLSGGGTPPIGPNGDYQLHPGDAVSCTISGATLAARGGSYNSGNGSINVYVKHGDTATSSSYPMSGGNETISGQYSGGSISFDYDTSGLCTSSTATVAYDDNSGAMYNGKSHSMFTYIGSGFSCDNNPPPPPAPPRPPHASVGTDTSSSTSLTRTYSWSVTKTVDQAQQNIPTGGSATFNYTVNVSHDSSDSNQAASGTISVSNDNDAIVHGVSASVDNPGCSVSNSPQDIPANSSATFNYSCSLDSDVSSLLLTASWPGQTLSNSAILLGGSDSTVATLNWDAATITAVNPSVSATDSVYGPLGNVSAGDANPTSFNYSETDSGSAGTCTSYPNTASILLGDNVVGSADKSVTVCDGSDLGVSKTASASFTRTYGWSITKGVDKTLVEKVGGGTGTFNYTVNVSHDSGTDSAWEVHGQITVTNPNDWEAITANVSDAIDNSGTCTVSGGDSVSIPASGSVTLDYTCSFGSYASASGMAGTNNATATWDASGNATPDGSASGSANYSASATIANGSVNVTDTLDGNPSSLGTVSYTSSSPTTYSYAHGYYIPANGCAWHANTASLSTGQSASKNVEVCGPKANGALSIGGWSNKNGIAIITGGGATAGVCNSGTWLRQFAPFADLSATASCAAENTYVQNVIKNASAAGAAMNAMLKAQMLGAALNLYFFPATVGSGSYDLAHVGAALENCSGGFGGSTSLTALQMLQYASSQFASATSWYGQNKTTQGLAKDAFDALDNNLLFSP
jgi:hypothetical protein